MSKLDLPNWAKKPLYKEVNAPVNTQEPNHEPIDGVNAGVNAVRKGDRHKPGYMAEYMRKYRAAKA